MSSTTNTSTRKQLGSIEGTNDGGAQFTSPEADYAEYIAKENPDEHLEAGSIVGIKNGKVSKQTEGAQNLMVISTSPIVIGNATKKSQRTDALVTFLGQVPVRVEGPITVGDYIIALGKNNGTGIAATRENIRSEHIDLIIGQALESSDIATTKPIKTLIGFPYSHYVIGQKLASIKTMKTEIQEINKAIEKQEKSYQDLIKKKQALIVTLSNRVEKK